MILVIRPWPGWIRKDAHVAVCCLVIIIAHAAVDFTSGRRVVGMNLLLVSPEREVHVPVVIVGILPDHPSFWTFRVRRVFRVTIDVPHAADGVDRGIVEEGEVCIRGRERPVRLAAILEVYEDENQIIGRRGKRSLSGGERQWQKKKESKMQDLPRHRCSPSCE